MRRKAQTGWFSPVNTTPALRATPPHLRRGVWVPLAQVVSAGRGTTGHLFLLSLATGLLTTGH